MGWNLVDSSTPNFTQSVQHVAPAGRTSSIAPWVTKIQAHTLHAICRWLRWLLLNVNKHLLSISIYCKVLVREKDTDSVEDKAEYWYWVGHCCSSRCWLRTPLITTHWSIDADAGNLARDLLHYCRRSLRNISAFVHLTAVMDFTFEQPQSPSFTVQRWVLIICELFNYAIKY